MHVSREVFFSPIYSTRFIIYIDRDLIHRGRLFFCALTCNKLSYLGKLMALDNIMLPDLNER